MWCVLDETTTKQNIKKYTGNSICFIQGIWAQVWGSWGDQFAMKLGIHWNHWKKHYSHAQKDVFL